MPGLFNLGLYQRRFGGNHRLAGPSINIGSTRGLASATRQLNWCRTHNPDPSSCINKFILITNQRPNYNQYNNYYK